MPKTVTCQCGVTLRLPEQPAGALVRCPRCKATIGSAGQAAAAAVAATAGAAVGTCPICQSAIAAAEPAISCSACDQLHHQECWSEVGGCGTYGCPQAPAAPTKAAATPLSAWGDTKICPVCGEKIKAIAVKCRYCGSEFDTVDPLTLNDMRRKVVRDEKAQGLRKWTVTLFVLSLVGLLAPLIALVSAIVLLPKRKQLAKEGPVYMVLGYSSIVLSLLYSLLMLFFALGS